MLCSRLPNSRLKGDNNLALEGVACQEPKLSGVFDVQGRQAALSPSTIFFQSFITLSRRYMR